MLPKSKFYLMKDLSIQSKEIDIIYDKQSFSSIATNHSSEDSPCKMINCSCSSRKKYTEEKFNNGRWTQEEQLKFIEGLFIFGNEWKKVQKYIKTRSSTQSRSHSQKFFIRFKKKYIDIYGEEELLFGKSNVQIDHILDILSGLIHCDLIAGLCNNLDSFFNGKDKSNQKELEKIVSENFPFAPMNLHGFLEEKKKKFFKIILKIIQNPAQNLKESFEKEKDTVESILSLNNENVNNYYVNKNVNKIQNIRKDNQTNIINSISNEVKNSILNSENNNTGNDVIYINNKHQQDKENQQQRSNKDSIHIQNSINKVNQSIQIKDDPFQLTFEEAEAGNDFQHCFYLKNEEEMNDNAYPFNFFSYNN